FRVRFFSLRLLVTTMRNQTYQFFLFSALVLTLGSCSDSEKPAQTAVPDSTAVRLRTDSLNAIKPTEVFRGTYKNQEIIFSHRNFQAYTLNTAGVIQNGHLNTERGYGDYPDAT